MKYFLVLFLCLWPVASGLASENIVVRCVIGKGKEAVSFSTTFIVNRSSTMEVVKEIRYPVEWEPPMQYRAKDDAMPVVVPVTPTIFETVKHGWVVKFSGDLVGGAVRLIGTATFAEPEFTKGVFGEASGRLYAANKRLFLLTENESQTVAVQSSTTPFQVFALPGKTYELKVKQLDKWVPCTISCEVAGRN